MQDLIAQLTQFIETYHHWAGPLLGLVAMGESLAVIGLFVPATALMLATGGLIGTGILDPVSIIVCLVIGAAIGDAISYGMGRWAGPTLIRRWPLNQNRSAVARARLFFRRHGFASIFLGRFFGPVRATIPLVAGMMGMKHRNFQIANVLSAIVWVPVMLAPGWLAATGLANLGATAEAHWPALIAFVVVATIVGTVISLKLVNNAIRRPRRRVAQQASAQN